MPSSTPAGTEGSKAFHPDTLFDDPTLLDSARAHLLQNDFHAAITTAFAVPPNDTYVYHATASVTLSQVQTAVAAGSAHGLHNWYLSPDGTPLGHPPPADTAAYIALFDPSKAPANQLKGFAANAKKDSIRTAVAAHLSRRRFVHGATAAGGGAGAGALLPAVPKRKAPHVNPYVDFLAWTVAALQSCGPTPECARLTTSHHVLPVLMHHFGCVCPTYEALGVIAGLAREGSGKGKGMMTPRTVLDIGSGNGYWTYMLRREPFGLQVVPVDSMQSSWRTTWVGDTVVGDAVAWLRKRPVEVQRRDVLLLVYPVTAGDFTARVIREFRGDVVCVAGTQNGSGYTGFKGEMVDEWFAREMPAWTLVGRLPLMSFPGKDDALFVFRKAISAGDQTVS